MLRKILSPIAVICAGLAFTGVAAAQDMGACGQPAALTQGHHLMAGPDAAPIDATVAIARGEPSYFEVEIATQTGITVETMSPFDDPVLILFDSDGNVVRADDDGAGSLNARVGADLSPGTYCVQVRTLTDIPQGGGSLPSGFDTVVPVQLRTGIEAGSGGCASMPGLVALDPVAPGFTPLDLAGTAPGGFLLTLTEQMPLSILARSNQIDTILTIEDANGIEVASDDDGGGGTNSYLGLESGLEPGEYCIAVTSFDAGAAGPFSLVVQDYSPTAGGDGAGAGGGLIGDPCGDPTATQALGEFGAGFAAQNLSGLLNDDHQFYRFDLTEPLALRLTATSNAFDTVLGLYGADGALITESDDADGLGTNSRISATNELPPGGYCVALSPFGGSGAGGFDFEMVELSEEALLAEAYESGEILPASDSGVDFSDLGVLERSLRTGSVGGSGTEWFLFEVTEESLLVVDAAAEGNVSQLALFDYEGSGLRIAKGLIDEDTHNRRLVQKVGSGIYALAVIRDAMATDIAASAVSIQRYVRPARVQ